MRTIKVTGKGQIKVKPDMTRITLTLEGLYPDYAETLRHSSEDIDAIKEVLAPFGFARADLKTLNFNVDTEYESCQENGAYKQRFIGYRFHHILKLEFDSDNERLCKILYALANCSLQPEFRISYTVKDPETAKNELFSKAVKDAKEKATVIAAAAGVALSDIQNIDYSWGEIDFNVAPMNRGVMKCASASADSCFDLDIEPDDIDVSDTVTVVWEIK